LRFQLVYVIGPVTTELSRSVVLSAIPGYSSRASLGLIRCRIVAFAHLAQFEVREFIDPLCQFPIEERQDRSRFCYALYTPCPRYSEIFREAHAYNAQFSLRRDSVMLEDSRIVLSKTVTMIHLVLARKLPTHFPLELRLAP
jgi:hypothetical protein